ncbi:Athe_2463 domain-containing protein [Brevibacillus sp. NPDC003359]|uniref:Athe_2463 domain-containing protein n=1 Tax=unclassified Brevibacillus TaxID=2684853 RepID=UPI00367E5F75
MRISKVLKAISVVAVSLLLIVSPYIDPKMPVLAGAPPLSCNLDVDSILKNNPDIALKNVKGKPLNRDVLQKRGYVTYGNPSGSVNQGEYRYIGYTFEDALYTNPQYPPDTEVQYHVAKSWTYKPWNDPIASKKLIDQWKVNDLGYNSDPASDQWLRERLVSMYPDRPFNWLEDFNSLPSNSWKNIKYPWDSKTLKEYGVIVAPPQKYIWGTFVMFNTGSGRNDGKNRGGDWYQDFLIAPDVLFCGGNERDLYTSYVEGGQFEQNVPKTTRVKVGLTAGSDIDSLGNVRVTLTANGSQVGTQVISLTKGIEKTLTFSWTPRVTANISLKAEINPLPRGHTEYWQKTGDVYANNVMSVTLQNSVPPPPINGACNIDEATSSYSKGISGKYYYDCPPYDEDGNPSTCVGYYYEELWVDMLKPNPEIVKAGQGTDITLKTTYENDNPAHAGKSYGGKTVILEAPNTDKWPSIYTENQQMVSEKTPGSWNNKWHPPYAKFDGDGNWMKHQTKPSIDPSKNEFGGLTRWYFGFDVPNGEEFILYGKVQAGYKNTLNACDGRVIRVEGTPFEDFVVRVVDPNNPFPTGEVGVNWKGYDQEGIYYDYTDRITDLQNWYSEPEKAYQNKVR